jgi:type III pantothenate kinase
MIQNCVLLDIGNSFTEVAFTHLSSKSPRPFGLKKIQHIPTDSRFNLSCYSIDSLAIVSSVVPQMNAIVSDYFKHTIFIDHTRIAPFLKMNLERPSQVGADRIVNAYAAYQLYGGPLLIIDSGTATTFCYVDASGVYQGGSIFPGIGLSSKALNDYTAKIPLIRAKKLTTLYGKTTLSAVQTGLYWGFVDLINGRIARFKADVPGIRVIGTGGALNLLKSELNLDYFEPHLIFKGLKLLGWEYVNTKMAL